MINALVELLSGLLAQPNQQPATQQATGPAAPTAPPTAQQPLATQPTPETSSQPSTQPQQAEPMFTTGMASPTRPPSANLPDVSNESIPLQLEEFESRYHIGYGDRDGYTGWHKTDGTALTPREEAIALRRASLLEHWGSAAVSTAASNARAAGTTLSSANMHIFLGDNATAERAPDMYGSQFFKMSPQWVPGQGPPPAFDASGAPIAGSVGSVVGGVTASGSGLVRWPPAPATPAQLQEYDRKVAQLRSGQAIISTGVGDSASWPPAANPRTVERYAQHQLGRYSTDDLAEFSARMMLDAARYEAGFSQPSNMFFEKPALFAAFKSGDEAAFAAALG